MTITTEATRVEYTGDGATKPFAVPFEFLVKTDLVVVLRTILTGVDAVQTLYAHYTVLGAGDAGGTVTFVTAPTSAQRVVIYSDPALTQLVDYQSGDTFPAETHEEALDRLTLQQKRTREIATRSLSLDDSDTDGSGAYDAKSNRISSLGTPTATTDAATKTYTDALVNNTALGPAPTGLIATGSVTSRTLADRWGEVANVKDFGAVGDGVADDTEAINVALAALAYGSTLHFPAGTYRVTSTLTEPPLTKWVIAGDGSGTIFDISEIGAANPLIVMTKRGAQMRDFLLFGDLIALPNYTVHGIQVGTDATGTSLNMLRNIGFASCAKALIFNNAHDSTHYDCSFYGVTTAVEFSGTQSTSQHFYNFHMSQVEQCVNMSAAASGPQTWSSCTFAASPYDAATIPLDFSGSILALNISGCRFEHGDANSVGDTWDSIYVKGTDNTYPVHCLNLIGNYFTGSAVENHIHMDNYVQGGNILGNMFYRAPSNADIKTTGINVADINRSGNNWGTAALHPYRGVERDLNMSGTGAFASGINEGYKINTLADTAAPSVLGMRLANTGGGTTITSFADHVDGQIITITADHSVTVANASWLKLAGSVNFPMAIGDTLTLVSSSTGAWNEISRTVNAGIVAENTGSTTHTFGSMASWGTSTVSVTCTGATAGMMVDVGLSSQGTATAPGFLLLSGHVPTAGTVMVTLVNTHGSPNVVGSGTLTVRAYSN